MATDPTQTQMDGERQRILDNAKRQIIEIDQYFFAVAHWNTHVRQPHEEPIDADPGGEMELMRDGLREMLKLDAEKCHIGTIDAPSLNLLLEPRKDNSDV